MGSRDLVLASYMITYPSTHKRQVELQLVAWYAAAALAWFSRSGEASLFLGHLVQVFVHILSLNTGDLSTGANVLRRSRPATGIGHRRSCVDLFQNLPNYTESYLAPSLLNETQQDLVMLGLPYSASIVVNDSVRGTIGLRWTMAG